MIDYRLWKINTSRATPVAALRAELEKQILEYMTTNTPAVRGVNNFWSVDVSLRDAILRQMEAGIVAALAMASAISGDDYVQASISGHVIKDAPNGIDERLFVAIDRIAPASFAEQKLRAAEMSTMTTVAEGQMAKPITPMEDRERANVVAAIESAKAKTATAQVA